MKLLDGFNEIGKKTVNISIRVDLETKDHVKNILLKFENSKRSDLIVHLVERAWLEMKSSKKRKSIILIESKSKNSNISLRVTEETKSKIDDLAEYYNNVPVTDLIIHLVQRAIKELKASK